MADEVCDNLTVNKISNLQGNVNVSGNIGIGTASPDRPLAIRSAGLGQELISFKDPDGNTKWHINQNFGGESPGLNFVESGVAEGRLFIKAGGNVGIGMTNPKYTLDVKGTINASDDVTVGGGDCAEDFDIVGEEPIEPGTVMVIDNDGALRASDQAYDKRVAGVISGAGDLRPGITLGKQTNKTNRLPLALTGKVYCKVDADYGAVEVGDLLTSSSTKGHAMKVIDHSKSLGTIIGKALRPVKKGQGLIPILVALQ